MAGTSRKIGFRLPTMLIGMFLVSVPCLIQSVSKIHLPYTAVPILFFFYICRYDAVHSGQGYNTTKTRYNALPKPE